MKQKQIAEQQAAEDAHYKQSLLEYRKQQYRQVIKAVAESISSGKKLETVVVTQGR